MNKDFTLYPEAFELKQLGFADPCLTYIYTGDTGNNYNVSCAVLPSKAKNFNEDDLCISTPTYLQAFRWFRDTHKLNAQIAFCEYSVSSENSWKYTLDNPTKVQIWDGKFDSYEEAELYCLIKLIEIVKGGNK